MHRKYLVGPFICTLACWTLGNGLMPLLPLYAIDRGASQTVSGLFFAFTFLCLALGTMTAGTLSKALGQRKLLLIASGVPIVVLTWLGGLVANVLQLAVVTGVSWFFAGVVFVQSATLAGLAAEPKDRGTALGILGMTGGLGGLIGGLGVGYLADRFGYRIVFESLAVFCILVVIGGLISVDPLVSSAPVTPSKAAAGGRKPGGLLILLVVAQMLAGVANATSVLGRSFSMNAGGYSKSTITLTASIQGLVSLCFPLILGWLSDRIGRRRIMLVSFAATSASLLLLAFSRSTWQFFTFAILNAFIGVSWAVGPAFVVDIVPPGNVEKGVSLFQSMFWIGNIAGMACVGYAFEKLGITMPVLASCLFPIAGLTLLLLAKKKPS